MVAIAVCAISSSHGLPERSPGSWGACGKSSSSWFALVLNISAEIFKGSGPPSAMAIPLLFQRHLVPALFTRIDQLDRQLPVPRCVNEVGPQDESTNPLMRAEVRRGVGPGHPGHTSNPAVDQRSELAELRAEGDHCTGGGRADEELGKQPA